jgi:hypothetical protein
MDWMGIYRASNEWFLKFEYILETAAILAILFLAASVCAFIGKGRRVFMDKHKPYDEAAVLRFYAKMCGAEAVMCGLVAADVWFGAGMMWVPLPVAVFILGVVYVEKSYKFRK